MSGADPKVCRPRMAFLLPSVGRRVSSVYGRLKRRMALDPADGPRDTANCLTRRAGAWGSKITSVVNAPRCQMVVSSCTVSTVCDSMAFLLMTTSMGRAPTRHRTSACWQSMVIRARSQGMLPIRAMGVLAAVFQDNRISLATVARITVLTRNVARMQNRSTLVLISTSFQRVIRAGATATATRSCLKSIAGGTLRA